MKGGRWQNQLVVSVEGDQGFCSGHTGFEVLNRYLMEVSSRHLWRKESGVRTVNVISIWIVEVLVFG